MISTRYLALTALAGVQILAAPMTFAEVLRVGPSEPIHTIAEAARAAKDGDVVEIAAGDYRGDVAGWTQKTLTIRGIGGMPRLFADGASAEGKGIFVVRGERIRIENLEFRGAKVPSRNGAGIRLEAGKLAVVGCRFLDNENGILTANKEQIELDVERSEFGNNGAGDGQSHNLYAGAIALLKVTGSYFHHAQVGHLLKSRARESTVMYNRLTDEAEGRASYELEFPSGGVAVVVGNIVEQAATTENETMVSIGAEGLKWPRNAIYLAHNTFVNDLHQGARLLFAREGVAVWMGNNLASGVSFPGSAGDGNLEAGADVFERPQAYDYRIKADAAVPRRLSAPSAPDGTPLTPEFEYRHPMQIRRLSVTRWLPGALQ
ncbi:hypothetical protein GCM10025771_37890 [Niveibacterium umoris]